jgi:predicted P-loop ATPase
MRGPRVVQFPARPWIAQLRSDRGRIYPDLANVLIALRNEPQLIEAFAFDEMLNEVMVRKPIPQAPGGKEGEAPPKRLTDDDVTQLQEWLQHMGLPRIGRETVGQAIDRRARELRFHPIRDYLSRIVWDGEPRLDTWLKLYMGAEGGDAYLAAIGRMFLISTVARVMKPGCKCDYMLVLEGEQGIQKSVACEVLAGADYFSDDIGDLASKDAKQHVVGKWLIEESELARFTRATTETLKSFVSRTTEKFRPPYGKVQITVKRQCVIVGTTNRRDYSKDETGARRLWPVALTGRIDVHALRQNRDQLFAEALDRFHHGENWWPDPAFEAETIRPEQAERRTIDAWEEPVFNYLAAHAIERLSVLEVATGALHMERSKFGTADQNRVKSCMSLAGWRKLPTRTDRGYLWAYVPKM